MDLRALPNFSPWLHPQAPPALGLEEPSWDLLEGKDQSWSHRTHSQPGISTQGPAGGQILDQDQSWSHRTHSQPAISTQGGGEERKEASTVQMGQGFAGKGRRIFRGLLEGRKEVCVGETQ